MICNITKDLEILEKMLIKSKLILHRYWVSRDSIIPYMNVGSANFQCIILLPWQDIIMFLLIIWPT